VFNIRTFPEDVRLKITLPVLAHTLIAAIFHLPSVPIARWRY